MSNRYDFFDDMRPEAIEVRASEVMACRDADQLNEWDAGLEAVIDAINAEVSARISTGAYEGSWLHRAADKLSFLGRGRFYVRRQLKAIGAYDPRANALAKLTEKQVVMKNELAFFHEFLGQVRRETPPEKMREWTDNASASLENGKGV